LECNYVDADASSLPGPTAHCVDGVWEFGGGRMVSDEFPPLVCPPDVPTAGTPCMIAAGVCVYTIGGCTAEDGWEVYNLDAQCHGTWQIQRVDFGPCGNIPADTAASTDAGSDSDGSTD
jgi:hypothetical protein